MSLVTNVFWCFLSITSTFPGLQKSMLSSWSKTGVPSLSQLIKLFPYSNSYEPYQQFPMERKFLWQPLNHFASSYLNSVSRDHCPGWGTGWPGNHQIFNVLSDSGVRSTRWVWGLRSYEILICPEDKPSGFPHMGVPCEFDLGYAAPFPPGAHVLFLRMFAYQRWLSPFESRTVWDLWGPRCVGGFLARTQLLNA